MAPEYDPTKLPQALLLKDAPLLLAHEYLPLEAGYAVNSEGMHHVAASTYMHGVSSKMIDWWFGFIHDTEQYKLWHPRDHVFSDWDGPRDNNSTYIGGTHLVHEYIGGQMHKLAISFRDPSNYFGSDWKNEFQTAGYGTAICGRVHVWMEEKGVRFGTGHLIHLIKDEPDGCRMRSRFWLGDFDPVDGEHIAKTPEERAKMVDPSMVSGLLKHATEEMAILAAQLPDLYAKHSAKL
jgi:hypothetical protein